MPYAPRKRKANSPANDALASAKYATALVMSPDGVSASIKSSAAADVLILETDAEITETVAAHLRTKGGPRVVIVMDAAYRKPTTSAGTLRFSAVSRTITGPRGTTQLSRAESALLACLLHSKSPVVTRARLRNAMFVALHRHSSDASLCVHICNIRMKLRTVSDVDVRTFHGKGYQLYSSEHIFGSPTCRGLKSYL